MQIQLKTRGDYPSNLTVFLTIKLYNNVINLAVF